MFDKRMEEVKQHFNIQSPEDWRRVSPVEVLARPNCAKIFLNYLRLNLANRGITLLDDETPIYWQTNLSVNRGGLTVSTKDNAVLTDFTILIDTGEQMPFQFQGFRADAKDNNAPLVVKTRREPLGISRGDYSIDGMQGLVHVERKSCQDAIGTVLGYGQRRDNFIKTLSFLTEIQSSAVIVECERDEMLDQCVPRGKKTKSQMQRTLNRQILAWEDDFCVPWIFNRDRKTAEYRTFLWLRRAWRHHFQQLKQAQKQGL